MWKIAVIDDQASVRSRMQTYLERYQTEKKEQFRLSFFENAEQFLERYRPEYDLVFMDIDMPGMNGLSAARRLRMLDEKVALIFITNLAQYAIKGYEVRALDYILKPVSYSDFAFKLTRALKLAPPKDRAVILLRTENGTVTLGLDDLTYVEIQGHYLFYHTKDQVYRVRGSLKQAEAELDRPEFFTCNKCYIVNLAFVEEVNGSVAKVGGDPIIISRPKKKPFMEALAAYYNKS